MASLFASFGYMIKTIVIVVILYVISFEVLHDYMTIHYDEMQYYTEYGIQDNSVYHMYRNYDYGIVVYSDYPYDDFISKEGGRLYKLITLDARTNMIIWPKSNKNIIVHVIGDHYILPKEKYFMIVISSLDYIVNNYAM